VTPSLRNRNRVAAHSGDALSSPERRRLRLLAQNALEDSAYDAREGTVTQETVNRAQRAVEILRRLTGTSRFRRRRLRTHPRRRFTPRASKTKDLT
jgi:hypothetical protein